MPLPTIVSFANFGYRLFSENLLRNARDVLKNHSLVFYCLDQELYDVLQEYTSDRIKIVRYQSTIPVVKEFADYGSRNMGSRDFCAITIAKIQIILDALREYQYIHFVDGDVVFCKEPTEEYYAKYSEYDIVYQRDSPPPNQPFGIWTCTGNFVLQNNERTVAFLRGMYELRENNQINDQECQLKLFQHAGITDIRLYPHAKLSEFPDTDFTCGSYVRDNIITINNIMVFHANHVTGINAKIGLLKKVGRWYM